MLQSYRCQVISKLEKTSLAVLLFYCLLIVFRPDLFHTGIYSTILFTAL